MGGAGDGGKGKLCAQFVGGHSVDFEVEGEELLDRFASGALVHGQEAYEGKCGCRRLRVVGARWVRFWIRVGNEMGEVGEEDLPDCYGISVHHRGVGRRQAVLLVSKDAVRCGCGV